jgi:hypothetical protein
MAFPQAISIFRAMGNGSATWFIRKERFGGAALMIPTVGSSRLLRCKSPWCIGHRMARRSPFQVCLKDAPVGRPVEPPSFGEVIQIPRVGGACIIFTRAKLPDRPGLPSARVRMQRALRSFAMRSLVSCGRTPTTRGLILGAKDMEYRSLR